MSIHTAPRLDAAIRAGGIAIDGVSIGTAGTKATYLVTPASLQASAQSIIDAFDDSASADAAYLNTSARVQASNGIAADTTALYKVLRAEAALMIDEINTLRQWITSFKAEVAAATTLADLKTRVATLPTLADRTIAQAKTAMQTKISAGAVD